MTTRPTSAEALNRLWAAEDRILSGDPSEPARTALGLHASRLHMLLERSRSFVGLSPSTMAWITEVEQALARTTVVIADAWAEARATHTEEPAAQIKAAEAREQAWKDRFKALVGDDTPDGAGNAVLRLQRRADNLQAQLTYVLSEIGRVTGVPVAKPSEAVERVRLLMKIAEHRHAARQAERAQRGTP